MQFDELKVADARTLQCTDTGLGAKNSGSVSEFLIKKLAYFYYDRTFLNQTFLMPMRRAFW